MTDAANREIERTKRLEKYLANVQAREARDRAHFQAHMEMVLHGLKINWEDGEEGSLVMHVRWPRQAIQSVIGTDSEN